MTAARAGLAGRPRAAYPSILAPMMAIACW